MNTLTKYNPNEVSTIAAPASWEQVKYWADAAGKFQKASLVAQVMAGFALAELRKIHGVKQGARTDLPHGAGSWPELVQANAGISDDTARRWILMAEGIKSRWKKLSPEPRVRELMAVPVTQWTDADTKVISDSVHKATDGSTQLEFMRELGLATSKQGNNHASGTGSRKLTTEEQRLKAVELAMEDSGMMGQWVNASNKSFVLTAGENDLEIDAQISLLEFAIKLRMKYRNTPRPKRDDALLAEIADLIRKESPLKA